MFNRREPTLETVMLRTSTLMAIALGVTTIASAATPAAALPSQVFGGVSPHIAGQLHPTTAVQASQDAVHVLAPKKPTPPAPEVPMKIPPGHAKTSLDGRAEIPVSKLPVGSPTMKPPQIPVSELPPPPYKPGPGVDNVCPLNPYKCPAKQKKDDDDSDKGHGPIVILTPPVAVPVPVAVPADLPVHVANASSAGVTAQTRPAVSAQPAAPQCQADAIPALAAGIDELLPNAQLSNDDRAKVAELRQMIQDLATDGKVAAARNVEEVAMFYLGYQKIWLQCGLGTFAWAPVVYNDAVRTADQSK
ncbi:hypothetical protein L6654_05955 [Bradyrhizobium sp. WYCCWR 13023]|uniref:Secreted protein n=1 Tax=Bradyrhizobium zhengyangense TaxID=2911009 RepID=A0A9X1R7Y0_9BRAD|nr:hypothetical protein [Bradyrhizobium zhengyangense]MCG2626168.1 hypothetical protein [Bradyrhizobium zhengyangense]